MFITQIGIAKNEEKNIENCYGKLKKYVNKQILVDTGSTDNTVKKAKELGIEVHNFEWVDDFSKARNFALSLVPKNTDWIIFLDLDEYIDDKSLEYLLPLINKANTIKDVEFDGLLLTLTNIDDNGNIISISSNIHTRIFKNIGTICYKYPIHEQMLNNDKILRLIRTEPLINIVHTGYACENVKEKNKSERNSELLFKELSKNPNNPRILYQLGESLGLGGDYDNAQKYLFKAIDNFAKDTEHYVKYGAYRNLLNYNYIRNNYDRFMWTFFMAIDFDKDFPDWWFLLGNMAYKNSQANLSRYSLLRYLELLEKFKNPYYLEIIGKKEIADNLLGTFFKVGE